MNALWTVTYSNYEFSIDRKSRLYGLVETKTGTVWADGLSLGWVELRDRTTNAVTRHDFGTARAFSISEKAGAQGKRILLGLDVEGVPLDIYLICSEREIQIVLESNRDSKTHTVEGFGLLPGLCSVPDDGVSHLVIPGAEGGLVFGETEFADGPIWDAYSGLLMPFVGAVRITADTRSAVAIITDSVYGAFHAQELGDHSTADTYPHFSRDPERRRLDVRLIPLPNGDHISIARTYREKIISDGNHVTLRAKVRERPAISDLFGVAWIYLPPIAAASAEAWIHRLRDDWKMARAICALTRPEGEPVLEPSPELTQQRGDLCTALHTAGFLVCGGEDSINGIGVAPRADALCLASPSEFPRRPQHDSLWDELDHLLNVIVQSQKTYALVGGAGVGDWSAIALDFWLFTMRPRLKPGRVVPVPLLETVYHDSVVMPFYLSANDIQTFLSALICLAPPVYGWAKGSLDTSYVRRTYAILGTLHEHTTSAFLTAHRFLTSDFLVEEAIYSDKTRIVINRSATASYETDEFSLPPLGFYVRHAQLVAHNALQVGDVTFYKRAWRIYQNGATEPEVFPITS